MIIPTLPRPAGAATSAQEAYIKASNTSSADFFGISTALAGDTLVVGAYGEDSDATGVNGDQVSNSSSHSGAAYVFVRQGANWAQQAYLKASRSHPTNMFGIAVAISGDTIVVGAPREDSGAIGVNGNHRDASALDSGAAYVFVRNGTNWTQQAYLKPHNTGPEDLFGVSVAISGDTIVVGAPWEDSNATGVNNTGTELPPGSDLGAAYVFVRAGTNWTQQAYVKASNPDFYDHFGYSVALSGNVLAVGAPWEDSNASGVNGDQANNTVAQAGAAYVFVRDGTNWTQRAYLKPSLPQIGGDFGDAIAISGHTVAVGSTGAGSAEVFVTDGTSWTHEARLTGSNTVKSDGFGAHVAASAGVIIVGAVGEDSSATGINGDENNDGGYETGAAYVFVRNGTNWTQQAYLKASNTEPNPIRFLATDSFGMSVAASGNTVAVGAYIEASSATGVNGNQADNSARGAGAVYVFKDLGSQPALTIRKVPAAGYAIGLCGAPDVTYRLQRAPTLDGPWETLAPLTLPTSGCIEHDEPDPPPSGAFYRVVNP